MTAEKLNILFLCTGNACRSQIAEGWARHLKSDSINAYSAGVSPIGVSTGAIKTMAEVGVDISNHTSKHFNDLCYINFDYVITLCDYAAESCPTFPGKAKVIHKPFKDPYFATGSEEHIIEQFAKVRDQIRDFVKTLPESLKNKS
ncbi:MAG: arsenate reductase ArsC [Sedimentisphaerales bacterium]|nr:arsenate reductase ArsC [Sedimentisphaerales bacterium]